MEGFFMREFRNVKIIAVDHGYGNIKTANTVTPTGITAYETEPIFTGNILDYNGTYYRIGEGHKEFIPDKAIDEDYYLLTLMAVARELNIFSIQEADVHLAAGLPLTWIRHQREEFRSYLLQNLEVSYRFNNKDYHIRFVGCSLYPQGYPAIVNRLGDLKGTNLLADIGNGTMNILYINNKKAQESRCWTEKFGVNQCLIAAKNAILDRFGVKIEEATVEQVLRFKAADISAPYLNCITAVARQYVANIFSTLRKYEYNPDLMRLYVVGGGGCMIRNFGMYDESRVTILDDICATAKGYEHLALMSLKRRE
jgi:plasmid segregation protein ParM